MKTYLDCIPCLLRQALDAARRTGANDETQSRVMRESLRILQNANFEHPPPYLAADIHNALKKTTNNPDPYLREKELFNQHAKKLIPEFEIILNNSDNPFETAVRLSIAGNIIDFGASTEINHVKVEDALTEALHAPLSQTAIADLKEAVAAAAKILVLGDNAGEIVLDRLLLSMLPKDKTTYAVRGAPIINDATRDDAEFANIAEFATVIDNGTAAPGTPLKSCSADFLKVFDEADLIISKGQGNFETLNDCGKHIFFLLRIKCPMVAGHVGEKLGALIIRENM